MQIHGFHAYMSGSDGMLNPRALALGRQPSAIRQLFAYGLQRKAEIGEDHVFDFSLGNPNVPSPHEVTDALSHLTTQPPVSVHSYTPARGDAHVRDQVARSLARRFDATIDADDLFMTDGASTSVSMCLRALTTPGIIDEYIVPTPYFPEYRTWTESNGGKIVEVPSRTDNFQLDIDAIAQAINDHTAAIIINSPNNPVGVVYSTQTLRALADVLQRASERYCHPIYIISDEPYRELVFDGSHVPWVPSVYDDTLVCYSWSKSLSLPGDRIGYVYVPKRASAADDVMDALAGAARALGFVCASATYQKVVGACANVMPDLAPYARNRTRLMNILDACGYTYIKPEGAFYLWMRALEDDAQAFSDRAKAHELLLVPSNSFGVSGWVRLGYCVSEKTIINSEQAFHDLYDEYQRR